MALTETKRRYIAYLIYTLLFAVVITLMPSHSILQQNVVRGAVDWPQVVAFLLIMAFPQLMLRRFTALMFLAVFVQALMVSAFGFLAHKFLTTATVSQYISDYNTFIKAEWAAVYLWQLIATELVLYLYRKRRK